MTTDLTPEVLARGLRQCDPRMTPNSATGLMRQAANALLDAAEREAAARKRVEELETALRPFADAASYIDACDIVDAAPLSNEHFYAARAALSTSTEQEKG